MFIEEVEEIVSVQPELRDWAMLTEEQFVWARASDAIEADLRAAAQLDERGTGETYGEKN